jgi:hypothetical protein
MAARDERLEDLFFVDLTGQGEPSEEGQLRRLSSDVRLYIAGAVRSVLQDELIKISGTDATPGYLEDKLSLSSDLIASTENGGANEQLQLGLNAEVFLNRVLVRKTDAMVLVQKSTGQIVTVR